MHTKDMLAFQGLIGCDIPLEDGRQVSVLLWDSTPTAFPSFSQLWIAERDGKRRCFIDPIGAKEVFDIYHHFDAVLGEKITSSWEGADRLTITLAQSGLRLVLHTQTPVAVRVINRLLHTPLAPIFARRGKTDTGMAYHSRPHRIAALTAATLETKDGARTALRPNGRGFLSWCTHYLQRNK